MSWDTNGIRCDACPLQTDRILFQWVALTKTLRQKEYIEIEEDFLFKTEEISLAKKRSFQHKIIIIEAEVFASSFGIQRIKQFEPFSNEFFSSF